MNKAFLREPNQTAEYCPRCGSQGQPVGRETLETSLAADQLRQISEAANFCPAPRCEVAYFDAFERSILATDLVRPAYPKNSDAPLCACTGLTAQQIEQDARAGDTTRVRQVLKRAETPDAACARLAANGQSCAAYVQKYYLQCLNRTPGETR